MHRLVGITPTRTDALIKIIQMVFTTTTKINLVYLQNIPAFLNKTLLYIFLIPDRHIAKAR